MGVAKPTLTRRLFLISMAAVAGTQLVPVTASESDGIAPQPYFADVNRAIEALAKFGTPIAEADAQQIALLSHQNDSAAVTTAEGILDRYTLARIALAADGTTRASAGGARRTLVEQGWRMYLVRVSNPGGRTENFGVSSGIFTPGHMGFGQTFSVAQRPFLMDTLNKAPLIEEMWLMSRMQDATPLSGFVIGYRVIMLYSRDRGHRSGYFGFGTSSDSFSGASASATRAFVSRHGVALDFDCFPSREVLLGVHDMDGRGCVASLTIKDNLDRIYPPQAMRLAPDMAFQPHIYRADGETVRLPEGEYTIESKRGPEYLRGLQTVTIDKNPSRVDVNLKRWIDPAKWGWYSGDPHIHAAGCAHYENPTEGVSPETMIRHVRGEALSIGEVLTWGPGWYYQKMFFSGHAESPPAVLEHPELQAANNAGFQTQTTPKDSESILRYDVEVSGFPSSLSGHLGLLCLKEQDYPGTKLIEDWPSWNLPILRWAKAQGAVAGYMHCGKGMAVDSTELPNHELPPFDSIGANEAIIDVTHGFVEFLSGGDGSPVAELNVWYHLLNSGYRVAMVGETDYPCIFGERPGVGRTYVHLDKRPVDDAGYNAWVSGLKKGRLYYGDGRTHFLEFTVSGRASGDEDVMCAAPTAVDVAATIAARLEPVPTPEILSKANDEPWNIEHARIGRSREVPIELVVNGIAVDRATIVADGMPRPIRFKVAIARSSWVALRVMASAHTYPVFVQVAGKPIRASKRSAQWCRASVDKMWEVKSLLMRESERPAATQAYDHARKTYDTIIAECEVD